LNVRYALIADIHGNLPALEASLADLSKRGADHVFHLGDLVGYGPWPDEVVERIREAGVQGISGNFDSAIAAGHEPRAADRSSVANFRWTAERVHASTRAFLGALPFRMDHRPAGGHTTGPTLVLVHATPTLNTVAWWSHEPDQFHRDMIRHAGARAGDLICFGHIHRPWYRQVDGVHLVSVGSVGRPKDADPRCCYALVDVDPGDGGVQVEFVRVEYDVERAAGEILRSGLPEEFAAFLHGAGAS
jgi:predicted phosphodiesterase